MADSVWEVQFLSCVILSAEVFWVFLFSFLQEVAVSFSGSALRGVREFCSLFWTDLSSSSRLMKDPERG